MDKNFKRNRTEKAPFKRFRLLQSGFRILGRFFFHQVTAKVTFPRSWERLIAAHVNSWSPIVLSHFLIAHRDVRECGWEFFCKDYRTNDRRFRPIMHHHDLLPSSTIEFNEWDREITVSRIVFTAFHAMRNRPSQFPNCIPLQLMVKSTWQNVRMECECRRKSG